MTPGLSANSRITVSLEMERCSAMASTVKYGSAISLVSVTVIVGNTACTACN